MSFKQTLTDESTAGSFCFFANKPRYSISDLPTQTYVACHYDEQWWIGIVIDAVEGDIKVNFLPPFGPSQSFYWPARQDVCWVHL